MQAMNKFRMLAVAGAVAMAAPMAANAESNVGSGATPTASARVDLRVTIPGFVMLRVGTVGTTVNRIEFTPAAAIIGNGTDVAASAGGDAGTGAVNVQVLGNVGSMTLTASALSLNTSPINTTPIPSSEILVTASTDTPHPPFGNTVNYTAAGGLVNKTGTWTYQYSNTNVPIAGEYNGTVTYTAAKL